ncbi:MAG: GNAT family N-acetyltransferase [Bacteroidetes bacterium]|nr:MAG: GNAT family N-acetyltransferase [Bacteroidota bacterium]REK07246.1 MAG: GNAT family N-acetyltransferase [Bacteroidota bacterium]REK31767.1 MAG: GNAT family N-acetyltransferase [Bacteroidota bacterium]REK48053.1 MAG: GNAT family N-acetyltransferase [Bacteroidota bacterium]
MSQDYYTEILDLNRQTEWNQILSALPDELQDINFSSEYHRMYEENGDGKAHLFVYREGGNIFAYPFMLCPIEESPESDSCYDIESAYGYTGPLSSTNSVSFVSKAQESFRQFCGEINVVSEFVRFHPLLHNSRMMQGVDDMKLIPLRDYVYLNLEREEKQIWESYSSPNRNKIRKARLHDATVIEEYSNSAFEEFRRIYVDNMRALHAAPMYYFSDRFFQLLSELLQSKGVLITVKLKQETVGAAVFLKGKGIGHYFLSSVDADGKKIGVSNLLLHSGVLWCKKEGLSKIHLGGGVTADQNDPLLQFKLNFSSNTEKFFIGKRIHNARLYEKLTSDWDKKHSLHAEKYRTILQRYRLREKDLVNP